MPESASIADGAAEQAPIEVVDNGSKSLAELMAADKRFSDPNTDWDKELSKPQEDDFDTREVDDEGFRLRDDNGNRIDANGNLVDEDTDTKETESKVDTKVEVETKTPTETKPAELPDDVKGRLQQLDFFEKTFTENPEKLAATIIKDLDPRARAAFMKELGITAQDAQRPDFDFEDYDAPTIGEQYVISRKDDIEAIPHVISDMGKLRDEVQQTHARFGVPIDHANLLALDLDAKFNIIAEHLGLSFPKADIRAMLDELKGDGRKTYGSVLTKHHEQYANIAKNAKQRDVERPSDPGRTTKGTVTPNAQPNAPFIDLVNRDPTLRRMFRDFERNS